MTQFRPGGFQVLPVVIKNLLIINGLVFLAQLTVDGMPVPGSIRPGMGLLADQFALHHLLSPLFKPWQLVTYLFMHGDIGHLFFNMFALWMFGSTLENLWGPKRFGMFYLLCGLGAALLHLVALWYESLPLLADLRHFQANPSFETYAQFFNRHIASSHSMLAAHAAEIGNNWQLNPGNSNLAAQAAGMITDFTNAVLGGPTLGASGAVFGCLAAFGFLYPNNYIYLYFLFPIKVKWFVIGYICIELFSAAQNSAGDTVAHVAHLGGALVGFLLVYFWNRSNRQHFY